jgi:hypothetical protein
VLHIRNKKHLGFTPKGRRERRVPLNEPALSALRSMLDKKHADSDLVFYQHDGSQWKSVLESFRSLVKRCGFKRLGIHTLRHTFGAHLAQMGISMAVIRDLLGHHSVTLTEKYYAHLAPSNLSSAVRKLQTTTAYEKFITQIVTQLHQKWDLASEDSKTAEPLTDSSARCYVQFSRLSAGVAKLAYAADSKSRVCFFCPLLNSSQLFETTEENDIEALKPFAGILEHFEAFEQIFTQFFTQWPRWPMELLYNKSIISVGSALCFTSEREREQAKAH